MILKTNYNYYKISTNGYNVRQVSFISTTIFLYPGSFIITDSDHACLGFYAWSDWNRRSYYQKKRKQISLTSLPEQLFRGTQLFTNIDQPQELFFKLKNSLSGKSNL